MLKQPLGVTLPLRSVCLRQSLDFSFLWLPQHRPLEAPGFLPTFGCSRASGRLRPLPQSGRYPHTAEAQSRTFARYSAERTYTNRSVTGILGGSSGSGCLWRARPGGDQCSYLPPTKCRPLKCLANGFGAVRLTRAWGWKVLPRPVFGGPLSILHDDGASTDVTETLVL